MMDVVDVKIAPQLGCANGNCPKNSQSADFQCLGIECVSEVNLEVSSDVWAGRRAEKWGIFDAGTGEISVVEGMAPAALAWCRQAFPQSAHEQAPALQRWRTPPGGGASEEVVREASQ